MSEFNADRFTRFEMTELYKLALEFCDCKQNVHFNYNGLTSTISISTNQRKKGFSPVIKRFRTESKDFESIKDELMEFLTDFRKEIEANIKQLACK